MLRSFRVLAASAVIAAVTISAIAVHAAPIGQPLAIKNNLPSVQVEQVQWRRGGWGGWGWGGPFVAGAIVGGALAAPYYYGPGPYYGPRYYEEPVYDAPPPGGAEAYCARRFKSYDPATGTYLGNDKRRHPCP